MMVTVCFVLEFMLKAVQQFQVFSFHYD